MGKDKKLAIVLATCLIFGGNTLVMAKGGGNGGGGGNKASAGTGGVHSGGTKTGLEGKGQGKTFRE